MLYLKITRETIEHVANLARLNLSDAEIEKMTSDMGNIITYMEKLNELDTSEVQPTAHIADIKNVFREDEVYKLYEREKILQNAPDKENGCFKVPKIVE